ncbi:MAG TPA: methylenetetrahydrofolate--tRNA-(uracil(54)-C(5))-methyltransferase (FADH(2)-oxidizing) TrmFO [Bryobacteraceae bacterium]|nr:methylenetetrahydrofolate--tRNA-(uracil(54)-C(5))-methyltransferase (FADH(2)-oxidizing) TrmFO [Bryobacteraceae bacterium]
MDRIQIIGAGLAGCEAAYQAAEAGAEVVLHEMRPHKRTPAHQTDCFGELVCSNSLKSEQVHSAPWLLKQEMRRLDSLLLRAAETARVPGGHALTVDRNVFSAEITKALEAHPRIEVRRGEVTEIPSSGVVIIASGPLTSDALAADISRLTGSDRLYFYDSISPIVAADSIDMSVAFRASRWGKSLDGSDDYVNCPFNKEQYGAFIDALLEAEFYEPHIPEDQTPYFEGCLPIEEIAKRGRDTLRFGPMKPAGLDDPRTGRWPYAVVQLRQENQRADSYNLVGFQNHMRFGDQARLFRMIPGLENAEFLRFGQMHRNTYINSPTLLTPTLQLRNEPRIFFAGQISGVEGYAESMATGLMAGRHAAAVLRNEPDLELRAFPRETALGSLCHYITHADADNFQPANITFDLLPALDEQTKQKFRRDKKARHAEICRRAAEAMDGYLKNVSSREYCAVSG